MRLAKSSLSLLKDPVQWIEERSSRRWTAVQYVVFLSRAVALVALCMGYFSAHSQALVSHMLSLASNHDQEGTQSSLSAFYLFYYSGLVVGCTFAFIPNDVNGRRMTLLYALPLNTLMSIWYSLVLNEDSILLLHLSTVRGLFGVGQGVMIVTASLYITEISMSENRGRNVCWLPALYILGRLMAMIVLSIHTLVRESHATLNDVMWRVTLIPIPLLYGLLWYLLYFAPESPRWLLAKRTPTDCSDSLHKLRRERHRSSSANPSKDPTTVSAVKAEFSMMYRALSTDARLEDTFCSLVRHGSLLMRLVLCGWLCLVLSLTANVEWIGSVLFHALALSLKYLANASQDSHSSALPLSALLIVTALSFCGVLLSRFIIDDSRRRLMIFWPKAVLFVLSFVSVGVLLWFERRSHFSSSESSFEEHWHLWRHVTIHVTSLTVDRARHVLLSIAIAMLSLVMSSSLLPLCWTYICEVFPYRARATLVSICFAVMALADTTLSQAIVREHVLLFSLCQQSHFGEDCRVVLDDWFRVLQCYFLLVGLVVLPLLLTIVKLSLPETAGVFLEDIEPLFSWQNINYCCSCVPYFGTSDCIMEECSIMQHPYYQSDIEMASSQSFRNSIGCSSAKNILFEPSTLHKYSHEMKECKFSYGPVNGTATSERSSEKVKEREREKNIAYHLLSAQTSSGRSQGLSRGNHGHRSNADDRDCNRKKGSLFLMSPSSSLSIASSLSERDREGTNDSDNDEMDIKAFTSDFLK